MSLRKLPEIRAFQKLDALSFEPPEQSVEAFDPAVISAANDEDATISIFGFIGFDYSTSVDNTEKRISAALRSIGKKDVVVNLNSPGGNFFNGVAIYNLLRLHPAKITVNILGVAGSAASVIAMAGDQINMGIGSKLMVHNASAILVGNKYDAHDAFELMTEIDAGMAEIYAARSGKSAKKTTAWMDRNRGGGTTFDTKSAIANGLVDGEIDAVNISVDANANQPVPRERVMEKALIASGMPPHEAKAFVAEFKAGTRDASANVTRDADIMTALTELQLTIKS